MTSKDHENGANWELRFQWIGFAYWQVRFIVVRLQQQPRLPTSPDGNEEGSRIVGKTNSRYSTECSQSGFMETEPRARFFLLLVHARPNTPFHLSQPRHPSQRIHLDLNPQDAHSSTHWKYYSIITVSMLSIFQEAERNRQILKRSADSINCKRKAGEDTGTGTESPRLSFLSSSFYCIS